MINIESFARKTPVIAHDLGALPEVINDSGGGFVYRSDEELLSAIERLAGSRQLRDQLGENGYRGFVRWWSREAHFPLYFDFLNRAALKRLGGIPWESDEDLLKNKARRHAGSGL
jgi:glycosyltransferase involved in cell wall biosynthesis